MAYAKRYPERQLAADRRYGEKRKANRLASRTERTCTGCGEMFLPSRSNQVHCRRGCRMYLRKWRLREKYDMTEGEYDALVERQDGRCAICAERPDDRLHVDHDHDTGAVRGLLCLNCNIGLGYYADDPDRMASAAFYLISHT
jgi:hypothetical protein